eukprot:COSAG06_NODE_2939_length_6061_cov_19.581684_4_plen_47_part_00
MRVLRRGVSVMPHPDAFGCLGARAVLSTLGERQVSERPIDRNKFLN